MLALALCGVNLTFSHYCIIIRTLALQAKKFNNVNAK